jgi:hypothetical protein
MRPIVRVSLWASILLVAIAESSSAQTPPTATEAFNLRIRCKEMADAKAESMTMRPLSIEDGAASGLKQADVAALNKINAENTKVLLAAHASNYDVKNNRCYIEIIDHRKVGRRKETEIEQRQVYDAQTDDLLSFAKIENGKKVGMVFDAEHVVTTNSNLGWDDANTYMDEKMRAKRN